MPHVGSFFHRIRRRWGTNDFDRDDGDFSSGEEEDSPSSSSNIITTSNNNQNLPRSHDLIQVWNIIRLAIVEGDTTQVQNLLKECDEDDRACHVKALDPQQGQTLLHFAAEHGRLEVVRYLLLEQ